MNGQKMTKIIRKVHKRAGVPFHSKSGGAGIMDGFKCNRGQHRFYSRIEINSWEQTYLPTARSNENANLP